MKTYWKSASSGDFANSANWTPFGPPGASDQAMLTAAGGAYQVLVGNNQTVLTIDINANATLDLDEPGVVFTAEDGTGAGANNGTIIVGNQTTFAVAGTINNNGTIGVFDNGGGTSILLLGDTTLNGGALTLSDSSGNSIIGGGTLTNAGNSDISGAGSIKVAVNNKATVLPSGSIIPVIDGSGDNNDLELDGVVTNTGELLGDGTGGLVLANTVNNIGGLVEADVGSGGPGFVELSAPGTIIGGTIESAGGTFVVDGNLDGGGTHPITLVGDISVEASDTAFTQGAFQNPHGSLDLESGSSLLLGFSNAPGIDTTFSGDDQIVLTNATIDLNALTHVGSTPLKLNNVNDIIFGTGTIGNLATPGSFVLNNEAQGIVEASGGTLTIYANVANAGVLNATGGTLALVENVVTGGTLSGAGTFTADDAVLDGSTAVLTNTSTIDMQALHGETKTLTLKGTINNTGTMELLTTETSGFPLSPGPLPIGSDLVIGATAKSTQVTLKGGGELTLDAYGNDYIIGDAGLPGGVATTLDNLSNIQGSGRIGDCGLTLKNGGSIDAEGSSLVIDTGARTVTNTGTLEGFNFSTLYVDSPLNNANGKLQADFGELVAAQGATGGTATLEASSTIEFGGPTTTAVVFSDNGSHSAALVLDDSVHFKGVISGFAKANISDEIDLNDINSATAQKVSFTGGVLTIKDGSGHTAQLHFSGTYTLASFNLNPDGHGGTVLTDPPSAPPPANAAVFGHYMAAAFAAGGASLSGLPAGSETFSQPLLASPHG